MHSARGESRSACCGPRASRRRADSRAAREAGAAGRLGAPPALLTKGMCTCAKQALAIRAAACQVIAGNSVTASGAGCSAHAKRSLGKLAVMSVFLSMAKPPLSAPGLTCDLCVQGVGKSCLVLRYVRGQFDESSKVTVGAAFMSHSVQVQDGTVVKFEIWCAARRACAIPSLHTARGHRVPLPLTLQEAPT